MGSLGNDHLFDDHHVDQMIVAPNYSPSDPVVLELSRHVSLLKEKEKELTQAYCEVKALRIAEASKDRAVLELRKELEKQDERITSMERQLEQKNLEITRLSNEKKEALAAQYAAEATLRRIHTARKDENADAIPIEAIIAPLESDIKNNKFKIAVLQEDNKALERQIRLKEAALVEAGSILRSALERALIVEDMQNENVELRKQIEIYHEENKILEKVNRQKVVEIEKLNQAVNHLEESLLACGSATNAERAYKNHISKLNNEKKTLERELARTKAFVNRVASATANEWKDDSNKVMPVKRWLEERRLFQGEIQRLREKISAAERSAKAEAQLSEKLKKKLKALEEGDAKLEQAEVLKDDMKQNCQIYPALKPLKQRVNTVLQRKDEKGRKNSRAGSAVELLMKEDEGAVRNGSEGEENEER